MQIWSSGLKFITLTLTSQMWGKIELPLSQIERERAWLRKIKRQNILQRRHVEGREKREREKGNLPVEFG